MVSSRMFGVSVGLVWVHCDVPKNGKCMDFIAGGTDCDGLVVVIDALEQFYLVNCTIFEQKRHV